MTTNVIRMWGTLESLEGWKALIKQTLFRRPSKIHKDNSGRHYFDCNMDDSDREAMMKHWYADAEGQGTDAQGRPWKWNCCIAFEVLVK